MRKSIASLLTAALAALPAIAPAEPLHPHHDDRRTVAAVTYHPTTTATH